MAADSDSKIQAIDAVAFKPSAEASQTPWLSPVRIALALVCICVVWAFWFLFTSKSVQLQFTPAVNQVQIDGGFSFELGGVWLLREGQYQVSAVADLHEPLATSFSVGEARNQVLEFKLQPLPGELTVITVPDSATVQIEGQAAPQIADKVFTLSAGQHRVQVTHPRYQTQAQEVAIRGKREAQQLRVELAPNWADVTVTTEPAGATVLVDDQIWPEPSPTVIEALAGEREIRVELDGHKTLRQRIFAQAGVAQQLDLLRLQQADAQVAISSRPAAAGVLLNGQYMGQTPLSLAVESGQTHSVEVVLSGYRTFQQRVSVAQSETRSIEARLQRLQGDLVVIAQPSNAQLAINGVSQGAANQTIRLPVAPQEVLVSLEGYASYRQTIVPKPGLPQEIKVRLLTHAEARLAALQPNIQAPDGQNLKLFEPYAFKMGASRREPGRRANETLRSVSMSRLFYLATHETSNAQFRKFASGHDSGKFVDSTLNEDDMPAVSLGWHDAAAYCNWLSEQAQLPPYYEIEFGKVVGVNKNSIGYRLPTEAEWSWAARSLAEGADEDAEKQLRFPWGNSMPPPDRHGNYADRAASSLVGRVIFGFNDNYAAAAPVGTFKPNHRGLYDMGGNVAEWMNDFYEIPGDTVTADPTGPAQGEYHVIKGGSWMHGSLTELRLSFRDYAIDGRQDVGFRIARYAE